MIAGEASGDLHGGNLAEALLQMDSSLQIVGIGGSEMRRAGVDVRFDSARLGIVGFSEVISKWGTIWEGYQTAKKILQEGCDLLVIIDFPDFNLRVAKFAKTLNIPVVYYIGPQLWAWRKGRIKTIAKRVDKMLVIFPFEESFYRNANVPCEFVGHPLLDEAERVLEAPFSKDHYLGELGLSPAMATLGLLPGSRKTEIERLLPVMLKTAEQLSQQGMPLQILIPIASTLSQAFVAHFTRECSLPIRFVIGEIYSVLRASDAVIAASGTVTLQAALTQTPMVVIYKMSYMTYRLARLLIDLPSVSLVNIVAEKAIVPELIQDEATPDKICRKIKTILSDRVRYDKMRDDLGDVSEKLGIGGASHRAAVVICQMLHSDKSAQK